MNVAIGWSASGRLSVASQDRHGIDARRSTRWNERRNGCNDEDTDDDTDRDAQEISAPEEVSL